MSNLSRELRCAFRMLVRNPAFTAIAVLVLALGIGAATTVFSFAQTLLLRLLPFEDPDRVAVVWCDSPSREKGPLAIPDVIDLQEQNRAFESLTYFRSWSVNLTGTGKQPERVSGILVSADFFSALGIELTRGRSFLPEDDRLGANRTVIVSHELWQHRFGGATDILGKLLNLDNQTYEVIGILPSGMSRETVALNSLGDLWMPVGLFFDQLPYEERGAYPGIRGIARLKSGVTLATAQEDMDRLTRQLADEFPAKKDNYFTLESLRDDQVGDVRPAILILLGAVGFVVLITCSNLAGLLLVRAAARRREIAIRSALGAGIALLVRQLLLENLLLALFGGAAGLLLAYWGLGFLPAFLLGNVPRVDEIDIDGSVLTFAAVLAVLTSFLFGLVPAIHAARPNLQEVLATAGGGRSTGGHSTQRLRSLLVMIEVALALVLLIGANLMIRSVGKLQAINPGFDSENLLTMRLRLPQEEYPGLPEWTGFYDQTLERVTALVGVESAAVTSLVPLAFGSNRSRVLAEDSTSNDRSADDLVAFFQAISPDYFRTLSIPLVRGRPFDDQDHFRTGGEQVVILSQALARRLWPDPSQDPLGKRISFEATDDQRIWREVVGVVGDVQQAGLAEKAVINIYLPHTQPPVWFVGRWPTLGLVAKAIGEPAALLGPIRQVVYETDPTLPIYGVQTMAEIVASEYAFPRMVSVLLTAFAILALLQAVVGVYGIVSYTVAQRSQEFSIRIALGAVPGNIFTHVLKQGFLLVLLGGVAGLATTFGLTRLMSSQLYGVSATDPMTFAGLTLLLMAVSLVAMLIPAWQATKANPVDALRAE